MLGLTSGDGGACGPKNRPVANTFATFIDIEGKKHSVPVRDIVAVEDGEYERKVRVKPPKTTIGQDATRLAVDIVFSLSDPHYRREEEPTHRYVTMPCTVIRIRGRRNIKVRESHKDVLKALGG